MTPQEEIVQLREQIKKMAELALKRARRMAIIFGVLAIAVLISFVYAFVQQVAAAEKQDEIARQNEKLALVAENEAIMARDRAENCARELAKCRALLK